MPSRYTLVNLSCDLRGLAYGPNRGLREVRMISELRYLVEQKNDADFKLYAKYAKTITEYFKQKEHDETTESRR
jgi:hypothetical protein